MNPRLVSDIGVSNSACCAHRPSKWSARESGDQHTLKKGENIAPNREAVYALPMPEKRSTPVSSQRIRFQDRDEGSADTDSDSPMARTTVGNDSLAKTPRTDAPIEFKTLARVQSVTRAMKLSAEAVDSKFETSTHMRCVIFLIDQKFLSRYVIRTFSERHQGQDENSRAHEGSEH